MICTTNEYAHNRNLCDFSYHTHTHSCDLAQLSLTAETAEMAVEIAVAATSMSQDKSPQGQDMYIYNVVVIRKVATETSRYY